MYKIILVRSAGDFEITLTTDSQEEAQTEADRLLALHPGFRVDRNSQTVSGITIYDWLVRPND